MASTAKNTLMSRNTEIAIEEGSTNVYVDLGYANAAEMQRKSQLAAESVPHRSRSVPRRQQRQAAGAGDEAGTRVKVVVGPVRRRAGKIELQFG